jgi:ferrous iron transport protein B
MRFALAGNQNCGKTTLFNQLTGSNQHVGNFPGVTVEQKIGKVIGHPDAEIVDLPGIYSLSPYTSEELVTRGFLIKEHPDGIINIVDVTNIERNLYLTLQLIDLKIPMVLALNMMDELKANSGSVDIEKLKEHLGIPVVPISASKNMGVAELISVAINTAKAKILPEKIDFCSGAVHRAIHAVTHLIEDHAATANIPARFAATKLLESDDEISKTLEIDDNEKRTLGHIILETESEMKTDCKAAMADMRYSFIENACKNCIVEPQESREYKRSVKLDNIFTHKIWGIPTFLAIILLVFWLTFDVIGKWLSDLTGIGINFLTDFVDSALTNYGINNVVHSLVIDGIFAGVGSMLSFLPIIVTLFFFLSILEDTGYMARIAYVMDKPLRKIGLSGQSFVPMLMGFGCTVPAVMATRTLSSRRDKVMTILLTPFMSCSAKVPIYALFTAAFFPKHGAIVMMILYLMGILLAVLSGFIMNKTIFKGNPVPFVMELPNYRFPSAKTVVQLCWEEVKDFAARAFGVILYASVIVWFLQNFDFKINLAPNRESSMLAGIGAFVSKIFAPLGFADWRMTTALITGFMAKEAVVSTMAVLTGSDIAGLKNALYPLFTPLTAFSFLTFTLLYTPCIAAMTTIKKELGSLKSTIFMIFYQTGIAWIIGAIVYQIGRLIL